MSIFTKNQTDTVKRVAISFGAAWIFVHFIIGMFTAMRKHPVLTIFVAITWIIYAMFHGGFGFASVDVNELSHQTESEYSANHSVSGCTRENGFTVCSYSDGEIVTYGVDDRISQMVIPTRNYTHQYESTPEYYRYVLHQMGISKYYAPSSSDMNAIVWHNIPNVREAVLRTDSSMSANTLTLDFK